MTENSRTSLHIHARFHLKQPAEKLEYQDTALLSKFKGNPSIYVPAENRDGNLSVSKGFDQLERASDTHAPVILRA